MIRKCINCGDIIGEVGDKSNHSITGSVCNSCFIAYQLRRWFRRAGKSRWTINLIIASDLDQMLAERKR